jgi:RNA polymerase sigma factor (sigma-70 family)
VEDRPTPTDAVLIVASLTDPARFEPVFERHYDAIHRYLARRGGWQLAEDHTMSVFLKAFESRHRFRPSVDDARPWLYGIATNVLRRHARTERRRLRAHADSPPVAAAVLDEAALADRVDAGALATAIYAALASLSARERDVLLLVAWADLSYEEIAIALRIPVGTVRSRLHRARGRLRELMPANGQQKDMHVIRTLEGENDG